MRNDADELSGHPGNISWGSVTAGAVAALGFQIMFTLLGAGLGLALVNPAQGDTPEKALGAGALIWWFVTGLIALAIGGWVAGRLAASASRMVLALHGLVTWGFAAVLTLMLVGSALGAVVGGSFELIKSDLSGGGKGVWRAAGMAREQASKRMDDGRGGMMDRITGREDGQERDEGDGRAQAADRDSEPLTAEERRKAEKAAGAAAGGSLLAFFALVLGAAASTVGGLMSHNYWDKRSERSHR